MMGRKKVMYLIGTLGHGRGGHFYSLKTTAESLVDVIEPLVVNIGRNNSPVIDSMNVKHYTVLFSGWNIVKTISSLSDLIKKENPDVIHTFDTRVLWFGRFLSQKFKKPIIHTVCGGPNPNGYFPFIKECIVYSKENLDFFQKMPKLHKSKFYFIPNRVQEIKTDNKRIAKIQKKVNITKTFLRISRFNAAYKKSMIEAIDLVMYLNNRQIKTQLILVGTIEDKVVYQDVVDYIHLNLVKNVYIFTEDLFTINASELINIADYIIGTGRGLMEAASCHKVLLTPVVNSKFPVLVTEDNFVNMFNTNFSPRNFLPEALIDQNIDNIVKMIQDTHYANSLKSFSKKIFEEYFFIETKKEEYKKIYTSIIYKKEKNILDYIENFLRTIRVYIKAK